MSTAPIPLNGSAVSITNNSVLLSLTMGMVGNQKKVSSDQFSVDADKTMVAMNKKLLESSDLAAVLTNRRRTKESVQAICLPSPFKAGMYLISIRAIERVEELLRQGKEKDLELVEKFLNTYAAAKADAEKRLMALYNAADYPPIGRVRSTFVFDWQYLTFNTPDQLRDFNKELFEQEKEKAVRKWAEATEEVRLMLRAQFKTLVDGMIDSLQPDEDGKKKRFYASKLTGIKEFMENFDLRNITEDQELTNLIGVTKQLLSNNQFDAQSIRDSEHLRDNLTKGFGVVKQYLDPLVETMGSRAISFDEE